MICMDRYMLVYGPVSSGSRPKKQAKKATAQASGHIGLMPTRFMMKSFQPKNLFTWTYCFLIIYHFHLIYFQFVSSRTF